MQLKDGEEEVKLDSKGLTLEFFNEIAEKYPKGIAKFKEAIDKYKSDNNWNELFQGDQPIGSDEHGGFVYTSPAPKYHQLPIAFQLGILLQIGNVVMDGKTDPEENLLRVAKDGFEDVLSRLEKESEEASNG